MIWDSNTPILPASVKSFFHKSLSEIGGLALIAFSGWLLLAIWGYGPEDSSLNTATSLPASNWMGSLGAIAADVMLQSFGVASLMTVCVFGVWGLLLFHAHKIIITPSRFGTLILATLLLGIFLIGLPLIYSQSEIVKEASNWGKIPCVGGVFSYITLLNLSRIMAAAHLSFFLPPLIIFALFMSVVLAWYSSGLSFAILGKGIKGVYQGFIWLTFFMGQMLFTLYKRLSKRGVESEDRADPPFSFASYSDSETENYNINEESLGHDDQEDPINYEIAQNSFFEEMDGISQEDLDDPSKAVPTYAKVGKSFSDFTAHGDDYILPSIDLLDLPSKKAAKSVSPETLKEEARRLEEVLGEFGVRGEIVNVRPGPVVTMFELKPAPGIKTSRVIGLADDIARSMSALSARIAVIPGQNVIGIELPNQTRQTVFMRDLLTTGEYSQNRGALPLILGDDIGGTPVIADLARMPHLLVAGTTGSGKSVSVNTMILSLLFKLPPERCKFIMVDPKMLELSVYDGIPHLLTPVVTDPKKAVVALKWAVKEMENRYRAMSKLGVRNIDGFNTRLEEARKSGEMLTRRVQTGFDPETGKPIFENQSMDFEPLPYLVVVVDEMADLMLVAGKEIEAAVQRLAQMARAAGIHLIMATQRPSVDVITGTIKANFPTRISFQVTSKIDSRTILGEQGAEQLLGQGDMLYMAGGGRITRVHGPFVKDEEVERIVRFLKSQAEPTYIESITQDDGESEFGGDEDSGEGRDDMYQKAVELIRREGKVSTSFVQRHLQIGYNRAARIVDQMESDGIVGPPNHVGKREIIG